MSQQYPPWSFAQMLERLPTEAQRRFKKFVADLEDTQAILKNHLEREKEAEDALFTLDRRIEAGDPDEAIKAEHAAATADLDQMLHARFKLNDRRAELDRLTSTLRHVGIPAIINELGYFGLAPIPSAAPKKGETIVEAIGRVRVAIGSTRAHLINTRRAPLPRSELEAKAEATIKELAAAGVPEVDPKTGKVTWDRFSHPGYPGDAATIVARMFAAIMPDQLLALLKAAIPDAPGLTATERVEREHQLERELFNLELEEETLILAAAASGIAIVRRMDASPYALLGLLPHRVEQVAEPAE